MLLLLFPAAARAQAIGQAPSLLGVPAEFILFGLTLAGVALWHRHTLAVASSGLAALLALKLWMGGFDLAAHLRHEAPVLLNLLGLLLGFALLARHFEESHLPRALPRLLPGNWEGCFLLLFLVFVLSSFLDNIAGALIGGTIARAVFGGRVHIGFLAAIVAASNAGGAGSVLGDTTTTMMWVAGVPAIAVAPAVVGGLSALTFFGLVAAFQQDRFQGIMRPAGGPVAIDRGRVAIVGLILIGAIVANVLFGFPAAGVWIALLLGAGWRRPDWSELPGALKGALFLLALVLGASLMPVEELPDPSWQSTLVLGLVSAVFDNIPLTKLAIDQGGYDWGLLAYAVGYGGSMLWFGSSAGVALATHFPQARSVGAWLRHGWHLWVGYVVGFALMLWLMGWHPLTDR
ncbi:MAG: citrate transporter [Candidatus Latescibacteria bacterium]|nr:citrate transporter [Candidatus Latescibacterota bacterium]